MIHIFTIFSLFGSINATENITHACPTEDAVHTKKRFLPSKLNRPASARNSPGSHVPSFHEAVEMSEEALVCRAGSLAPPPAAPRVDAPK